MFGQPSSLATNILVVPNNDDNNALITTVNYSNTISEEINRDSVEKSVHRNKVLTEIIDYFRPSVLKVTSENKHAMNAKKDDDITTYEIINKDTISYEPDTMST